MLESTLTITSSKEGRGWVGWGEERREEEKRREERRGEEKREEERRRGESLD